MLQAFERPFSFEKRGGFEPLNNIRWHDFCKSPGMTLTIEVN
jgi:hypothetical protein